MSNSPSTPQQSVLNVGDEFPRIELLDEQERPVDLRQVAEDSTVILFFYPRDNGIRCRTQACSMRDSWPLLRSQGIEVFGVNHQDAESHRRFRDRYHLPFPLLSDPDLRLARAFGFVNSWAVPPISPIERSTAIIDPGGRIRAILRRVRPSAHFDILRADLGLPERAGAAPLAPEPELGEDIEVGADEKAVVERSGTQSIDG